MNRAERSILVVAGIVALLALTRLSSVNLLLATGIVGTIALGLTLTGLSLNSRAHASDWNRGWIALTAGLALDVSHAIGRPALGTTSAAADLVGAVAGLLTVVGLGLLIEHRERGRAVEFALEGLIVVLAVGSTIWLHLGPGGSAVGAWTAIAALAPAGTDLVALWMLARLLSMTKGHPAAYRILVASLAIMFAVDAIGAGATLSPALSVGTGLGALQFWGFVLWGAATVHPSLSDTFEPVPALRTRLTVPQVGLLAGAMILVPATFGVRWLAGSPTDGVALLVGGSLISAVVVVHLVRLLQARATTEYRAQHDPLTGLPNRILFQDRLDVAISHARRSGSSVGVFFLDLDRFKTVNDSLGHDAGNRLLQEVARRLRSCLREQDSVARLGGDEFSLLVSDIDDLAAATAVAHKVLLAFEEPFGLGDRSLHASTSIGIAMFPDHGLDPEVLLKNADTAMYRAKSRGRATFQVYTNEMSARARVKLSLESGLHGAIERGELALHYQPQVDQRDGSVTGLEALLRWTHPRLGDVSPGAFVSLAEESGLIIELGEWVLESACRQVQAWRESGVLDVPVGVNVSARQFASRELSETVTRVLQESGLPGDRLEIELTESIFHRDLDKTCASLSALRSLGVRCSIDDFGTGYSGLSYLARLPIDRLKIDQSFVQHVERGDDASVVEAVVALATSLRMNVIAEGVETAAQAEFLLGIGCNEAQGYRYSRPLRPEVLERWLIRDPATGAAFLVPAAADPPVVTWPAGLRLDGGRLGRVLAAVCAEVDDDVADTEALDAVLDALRTVDDAPWLSRPVANRMAAGTLAGLLPLASGAAAAGALPERAQVVASSLLQQVGLAVAESGSGPSRGTDADTVLAGPASGRTGTKGADGERLAPIDHPAEPSGYEVAGRWLTLPPQTFGAATHLLPVPEALRPYADEPAPHVPPVQVPDVAPPDRRDVAGARREGTVPGRFETAPGQADGPTGAVGEPPPGAGAPGGPRRGTGPDGHIERPVGTEDDAAAVVPIPPVEVDEAARGGRGGMDETSDVTDGGAVETVVPDVPEMQPTETEPTPIVPVADTDAGASPEGAAGSVPIEGSLDAPDEDEAPTTTAPHLEPLTAPGNSDGHRQDEGAQGRREGS